MPRVNPEARLRLVATAADMLRRRGMNATSIRELAKAANAPLGSTYHYFPEGKKQVIVEAVQFAGQKITQKITTAFESGALAGLASFLLVWRNIIESTDFKAGCPVLAVAMEEATTDEIQKAHDAAAKVFNEWHKLLASALTQEGIEPNKARALATMIIASAEGALAMCRATKEIEPFDQVTSILQEVVTNALNAC